MTNEIYKNNIGLQRWIMDNIEVVNALSSKGFIPIELNDDFLILKQVGYPVTYSYNPETGTVTRVDRIYETV